MKDTFLTCSSCGIKFLWTVHEQELSARAGEPPPGKCPGCRALDFLLTEHEGTVRFYNPRKGWGFIDAPGGRKVFFHRRNLRRPVSRGTVVRFRVSMTEKGLRATSVRVIGRRKKEAR